MQNIIIVFNVIIRMMNTRLNFSPFSFTIYQLFIALFLGGVIVFIVNKIFE